jgi:GNAT superfamily N-acetyltransferase
VGLPADYELRPPKVADLAAVAAVLVADQRENGGEAALDAHFIRQQWSRPGFDLATDAWVVTSAADGVVAYGQVRREEPEVVGSWGVVHPNHRGLGIGSALFDRIDARASDLLAIIPAPRFRHAISVGDAAAERLLTDRGLRPIRHFWHMQIDINGPIQPGPDPAAIEIRSGGQDGDLEVVHAVLEEAFRLGGDPIQPFGEWADEQVTSPSHDPTLWLLAWDGATPVGALTASVADEAGWVDWLGVRSSHRGRGIASALLRRSFAAFSSLGLPRARLNVDAQNPTGATAVYERAGMDVINRWDLWERSPDPFV